MTNRRIRRETMPVAITPPFEAAVPMDGVTTPLGGGPPRPATQGLADVVQRIPIKALTPSPRNPRTTVPGEGLQELAESIKALGILEPLIVRERIGNPDGLPFHYEIIAGLRRFAAAALAGLEEAPCIVKTLSDDQALLVSITENLQRENLTPSETLAAVQALIEELHMTQEAVGEMLGKTQAWVSQHYSVARLPAAVRPALDNGVISITEAREIAVQIKDPELQEAVFDQKKGRAIARQRFGDDVLQYASERPAYRAQLITQAVKHQEERAAKVAELQAEGKTVVDTAPTDGVQVNEWDEIQKDLHEKQGKGCIVCTVNPYGGVTTYCTDAKWWRSALRSASKEKPETAWERNQREEREKEAARKAARDHAVQSWLAKKATTEAKLSPDVQEFIRYATRENIDEDSYGGEDKKRRSLIAGWLQFPPKTSTEQITTIVSEGIGAPLLQVFLASVVARYAPSMGIVRSGDRETEAPWLAFLDRIGYVNPFPFPTPQPRSAAEQEVQEADDEAEEQEYEGDVCEFCDGRIYDPSDPPADIRNMVAGQGCPNCQGIFCPDHAEAEAHHCGQEVPDAGTEEA